MFRNGSGLEKTKTAIIFLREFETLFGLNDEEKRERGQKKWLNDMSCHDIQHNGTQSNDSQHHSTQHNASGHKHNCKMIIISETIYL